MTTGRTSEEHHNNADEKFDALFRNLHEKLDACDCDLSEQLERDTSYPRTASTKV